MAKSGGQSPAPNSGGGDLSSRPPPVIYAHVGVSAEAEDEWLGVQWPQVAMRRNCQTFQFLFGPLFRH